MSDLVLSKQVSSDSMSRSTRPQVRPSRVSGKPFTLDQELKPFATWTDQPIWMPPKGSSTQIAESMIQQCSVFSSQKQKWAAVLDSHREEFTQVREIELSEASIRLPKDKLFVSVTEPKHFDRITDKIPARVQTRLDEFMAGPGKRPGVKVYYLKPLCFERDDQLIFTSREDLMTAVKKIQDEVFREYRRLSLYHRPAQMATSLFNTATAVPRLITQFFVRRRQKMIDDYQAKLEFQRRKTALRATRTYQKCRGGDCTFDDMLALTNPLERADVIEQYGIKEKLSRAKRDQLIRMAGGQLPWFVAVSMGISYLSTVALSFSLPVVVCDPAFVAEMPGSNGMLLKIGHFDEVNGVTHVEL